MSIFFFSVVSVTGLALPSDQPIWETMVAHLGELISEAVKAGIGQPTSRLASMLGRFIAAKSLWPEAEFFARLGLEIDERMLEPDHPRVAVRLNNLAQLLQDTNRLSEAEDLSRRCVVIHLRFTHLTGHLHPNLRAAFGNYLSLTTKMALSQNEIGERMWALRIEAGFDRDDYHTVLEQVFK